MEVMDKEVSDLMAKGAIEYASGPGFTSPLFTIPKKTGELRPVLNLRALNQFLPSKHFKMETIQHVCQLINPGDYLTSIDLRDAFLHVPMHQSSRKFLQFRWRDRLHQFKVLPFGLSLAPLVFTKVLRPLLQWARSKGIRISAYLDDLIIVAATKELSLEATRLVLNKLERLGFLVKESKSSLTPSTTLQHLGFEIDTVSMSLKVPGQKIRDLRREASKLINKTTCTIRQLASFIGKAVAMTAAVFPARLKVQRLLAVKIQALKSGASWSDLISIPHEATAELLWWRTNLQQWNGQSWIVANPQVDIYTDASSSGWGVVINNKSHSGIWNTQQQSRHINYKELLTVFIALKRPSVQGRTVNIISDNVTTIAYINHFGGTRSPELMRLATTLWNWCLSTGTRIRTTYVPSAFNPADAPSRRLTGQLEWAIDRKFFRRLDQQWGPHHVDLFASPINHHLPRYMTWKPSEGAVGHDALQHLWKPLGNVYLCPPWNLISPALQKNQTGEDNGDHYHTALAVSSLVPDNQSNDNGAPDAHSTPSSSSGSRKRPGHTREESPLVFVRLEDKRRRLLDKGWNNDTASIVIDNPTIQRRHQQYASIQDRYIQWAASRGIDPLAPQPVQLLNWLASGISIGKWSSGTVQAYKAAIIHMYEDKTAFSDPDFVQFFQVLRQREIKHLKHLDVNLTPVLEFFRSQGPNEGLENLALTQKLCWLLGTCGFLRPNDVHCIDLSNNRFLLQDTHAVLPILIPKETRSGSRICRYTTIKNVDDPLVCPVKTLHEYLGRIRSHEIDVAHPKDAAITYRPLIRDARDFGKSIGTERISKHISTISDLMPRPIDSKRPKARAIGSSVAIKNGARKDDIVTHGNWSSSILFDQFYQLNSATSTNFTAMVLE